MVSVPIYTLGLTKSSNCVIILQYNLHLPRCTFPNAVSVYLSFQNRGFLPGPKVLIIICDAFIASNISTMKVSFQIWKQIGPKV